MSKRGNGYGSTNRVNILKKVKVGRTWNLYPAVVEPNGKLRDKVRVRGEVEVHPEGYYYIEWWQDGRKRQQIKDCAEVLDRARRKALELEANRAGIETVSGNGNGRGPTVAEAVAAYLKDMEPPQREPKTYAAYRYCLELFSNNCAKRYVQDVKREDVLAFIRKLYELKCGPRTAYNRAVIVSQLLKTHGITKLLSNRDWPEYVEPIRPIYEDEEIQSLLKACKEKERVLYLCYLLTGLRDREMRHLTWRDIDFRTQVVRVTGKPLYGFKPKNKEERRTKNFDARRRSAQSCCGTSRAAGIPWHALPVWNCGAVRLCQSCRRKNSSRIGCGGACGWVRSTLRKRGIGPHFSSASRPGAVD